MVETTTPPKRLAIIIKDYSYIVGVASRVGKLYILDILVEYAIPIELITD